jgi:pheromone shutdown protein TraB
MEVFPGSEFRIAYQEAKACGAKVVLGDQDVQVIYIVSVKYKLCLQHFQI